MNHLSTLLLLLSLLRYRSSALIVSCHLRRPRAPGFTTLFAAQNGRQRIDFKKLLDTAKQTATYGPAVEACMQWLKSSSLSASGLTSVIGIFDSAGLVDDAITALAGKYDSNIYMRGD